MSALFALPADVVVAADVLAAVGVSVLVHYEGLRWLATRVARGPADASHRRVVLASIFGIIALHIAEIWVFGLAWWSLLRWPGTGSISGDPFIDMHDAVYLSATAFTSLGFDGATPIGPIRLLAGTEALTGLGPVNTSECVALRIPRPEARRGWRRA